MTNNSIEPVAFLKGKRVRLRPVEERDTAHMYRWQNDPDVRQFLRRAFPLTLQEETKWVAGLSERSHTNIVFAIETTADAAFIGTMGLHKIDWVSRTAVTGTAIGEKTYWGKGYGTDAKMVLLKYAFHTLGLRKVCASAFAFNERSIRFNKNCGYKEEGRLKKQVFSDGEYVDEILLAVFEEDWRPLWDAYCAK